MLAFSLLQGKYMDCFVLRDPLFLQLQRNRHSRRLLQFIGETFSGGSRGGGCWKATGLFAKQ